jgi:hypothetical protein
VNVRKAQETLERLYRYGEAPFNNDIKFLEEQGLLYESEGRWVVTRGWIQFGYFFERRDEFIKSLYLFISPYRDYLLHHLLITGIAMRQANNLSGLKEFVDKLPRLAGRVLEILKHNYPGSRDEFPVNVLEKQVEAMRPNYRDLDDQIFSGLPGYQRISYYLETVQQYNRQEEPEDRPLGSSINDMWARGRKISTLDEQQLQDRPVTVLAPFKVEAALGNPVLEEILGKPWQLLLFMLGAVLGQYEAQGQRALALRPGSGGAEVFVTTFNNKELRYGTLDQLLAYFCRAMEYTLFPMQQPDGQKAIGELLDRGVFVLKDGEYRIRPELEELLYWGKVGLAFTSRSKTLRANMEKLIDGLRV